MTDAEPDTVLPPVTTLTESKPSIMERIVGWIIDGPDPVEANEPTTLRELLLPWPVRVLTVVVLTWAAAKWRDTGIGQQIAWGLQFGGLAAVSIIASYWLQILLIDATLAALWFLPLKPRRFNRNRWLLLHVITYVNRLLGHLVVFGLWLLVFCASCTSLSLQIGGIACVMLLGPPVVNAIARQPWRCFGDEPPTRSSGGLYWRRRVLIYAMILLALSIFMVAAPKQLRQIVPLIVALGVAAAIRTARFFWRLHRVGAERAAHLNENIDARAEFRLAQAGFAHRVDSIGPMLVLAVLAGAGWLSNHERGRLDAEGAIQVEGAVLPTDCCGRERGGPVTSEIAMFIMADTQTHELGGKPYSGQTELVNALVGTASRPVALDLLSGVPIWHFRSVYRELAKRRAKESERLKAAGRPALGAMLWAHLGDMADLACVDELNHIVDALRTFSEIGPIAGIALGNHDVSFIGSFHWSPHWDSACRSGRLVADTSAEKLEAAFQDSLRDQGGQFVRLHSSFFNPAGGVVANVVPLGVANHYQRARGVIGVFLDSSDGRAFDWGSPGSVGAVSAAQLASVTAAISNLRRSLGGVFADHPAYVLFQHVPFGELASDSRTRVGQFIAQLDEKANPGSEPRVLALVTGHKHVAGGHRHCVNNSILREIVVGSTTDAPQQASILTVGSDPQNRLSLAMSTLQSVARPGLACDRDTPAVSAADCRQVAARLAAHPACRSLMNADVESASVRDCQDLEHPFSLAMRFQSLVEYRGPRDVEEKRRIDEVAAGQLLSCVCRDNTCTPSEAPLKDTRYLSNFADVFAREGRATELVCLAWAASAIQSHKSVRMNMGEALRCSFDDPTIPSERVSVATLEAATCY